MKMIWRAALFLILSVACAAAQTPISGLPIAAPLTGQEVFPIVQQPGPGLRGVTKQLALSSMRSWLLQPPYPPNFVPPPSASVLGGVFSSNAPTHQFATGIGTSGAVVYAQPSFSDISGSIGPAQIPLPTPTTLGGILSSGAGANQFANGVNTLGQVTYAQPGFANLSGQVTAGQLAAGAAASNIGTLGGALAGSTLPNPVIANSYVTLAMLAPMAANSVLGNATGSAGAVTALTALPSGLSIPSPNLTGTPISPTPTPGDNSTKVSTTAFVQAALAGGPIGAAGGVLAGTYPNPSAVHITPFGAPSFVDLAQYLTDVGTLRAFGYVGDGASHPLSSVTSFNGQNSTGWTLTQWQAVLPAATALSDEIDWAALQSYINAAPTAFNVPIFGSAVINESIATPCGKQISFNGTGSATTKISVETAGISGFKHCQTGSVTATDMFQVRNLALYCSASGNCGDALDVKTGNNGAGSQQYENLLIGTTLGTNRWTNGLISVGAGQTILSNVIMGLGFGSPISGTCFGFTSNAPFTVVIQILNNSHVYSCGTGLSFANDGTDHGIEGVYVDGINADEVLDFVKIGNSINGYTPPQYVFHANQASYYHSLFSTFGTSTAANSEDIIVDGGWFIPEVPNANSGTVTPTNHIDFGSAGRVWITHTTATFGPSIAITNFLHLGATATSYIIRDNRFLGSGSDPVPIMIDSGATIVDEFGNVFNTANNPVQGAGAAGPTVRSEANVAFVSGGLCYVSERISASLVSNARAITCSASATGSTSSGGILHVTYPWTFSSGPFPVVNNGDFNVCAQPFLPGNMSATGFDAMAVTGCASIPVRVNYTVTGQ